MAFAELAYLFRHALLRDAAYDLQLPGVREDLHALAKDVLIDLFGAPPPVERLGHRRPRAEPHPSDAVALEIFQHILATAGRAGNDEVTLWGARAACIAERDGNPRLASQLWAELSDFRGLDSSIRESAYRCACTDASVAGDLERALEIASRGVSEVEAGELSQKALPSLLAVRGHVYILHGRKVEAGRDLDAAVELTPEEDDWAHASILRVKAGYLKYCGDYTRARDLAERAQRTAEVAGEKGVALTCLSELSILERILGNTERAFTLTLQGLKLAREAGSHEIECVSLGSLGFLYFRQGKHEQCETTYLEAIELARKIGAKRLESSWNGNLGILLAQFGRMDDAGEYLHRALALARESGMLREEGVWISNLGSIARKRGDLQQAAEYNDRALDIARQVGDRAAEAARIHNAANILNDQGRVDDSLRLNLQALQIAREAGYFTMIVSILTAIGKSHSEQGRFDEAERALDEAIELAQKGSALMEEGIALATKAMLQDKKGEKQAARTSACDALDRLKSAGSSDLLEKCRQNLAPLM